jgi:hypothetical protein
LTKVPERVFVAQPPMGAKVYVIERPGLFVLEEGPGTLITDACTHAGAGGLVIYDGMPDNQGYFPESEKPTDDATAYATPGDRDAAFDRYGKRHGRELLRQPAAVMGSWMLNAGFHNGLTIDVSGGHMDLYPVASIVWQPFRRAV